MNIKAETVNCMTGLTREGGVLTAQFFFPETYRGFQGHFPVQKVLPGVCQILCAQVVIEQGEGIVLQLSEVVLAKYAAPVLPGETLTCSVQCAAKDSGGALYKVRLDAQGKKVAELKLRFTLQEAGD